MYSVAEVAPNVCNNVQDNASKWGFKHSLKEKSRRAVDFQIWAMPYPMQIFALEFTHHKAIGKSHKKIDMQS